MPRCGICGTPSNTLVHLTHCFVCNQKLQLCTTCNTSHSIRHSH